MHISKKEAEAEAIRIAEAFVAANVPHGSPLAWERVGAVPDVFSPGCKRRKTVIRWTVRVKWIPEGGGVIDGDSIVHVNIEEKRARWMEQAS